MCVQCDLWRALRLPGILVGDSKLGGISTTIAAHDCLHMRGYDIPAIVLTDTGLQNWKYLRERMSADALVLSVPECPPAPASRSDCSAPFYTLPIIHHTVSKPKIECLAADSLRQISSLPGPVLLCT